MRDNNRRQDNRNNRSNNQKGGLQGKNPNNLLPSPKILESYENISAGSVNKLIEMTKKEQEHRHAWQEKYLKFHNFSYKLGLVFGFIYNIALLVLISNLIKDGNQSLALKLFTINAGLLVFAIVVTTIERRIVTRKPPRRMQNSSKKERQPSLRTQSSKTSHK
jgi:uncharacterized membrane protein